jgi:hypothetical protein
MLYFYKDCERTTYNWYDLNGTLQQSYPPVILSTNVSSTSEQVKNSINAGKFVKNIFRINPYEVARSAYKGGSGSVTTEYPAYGGKLETAYGGALNCELSPYTIFTDVIAYDSLSSQRDYTLQKAYAKVGQSALGLGVELGELKETFHTIVNPLASLRSYLVRGKLQKTLRSIFLWREQPGRLLLDTGKTVAETWAEIRYGLRPLLMSVQSVMEEIDRKVKEVGTIRREAGVFQTSRNSGSNADLLGYDLSWKRKLHLETSATVRSCVYYRESFPRGRFQNLGLAPEYIPEIAWELTRLSFVLDWILSVGNWLGSYRVKSGIEILGNTVSTKLDTKGKATVAASPRYPGQIYTADIDDSTYYHQSYKRLKNVEKPWIPIFTGVTRLDILKLADLASFTFKPAMDAIRKIIRGR